MCVYVFVRVYKCVHYVCKCTCICTCVFVYRYSSLSRNRTHRTHYIHNVSHMHYITLYTCCLLKPNPYIEYPYTPHTTYYANRTVWL